MDPESACKEIQKVLDVVEYPDLVVAAINTITAALDQYHPPDDEVLDPDIAADIDKILDLVGRDLDADSSPYCEAMGECSYHGGYCGYFVDIGEGVCIRDWIRRLALYARGRC